MIIPRGDFNKHVEAGDIVKLHGTPRLVASVHKNVIFFVRWRASHCWRKHYRNVTAGWDLPLEVTLVQRATPATRALAERFAGWFGKDKEPITADEWHQVCDLRVAAIRCCTKPVVT